MAIFRETLSALLSDKKKEMFTTTESLRVYLKHSEDFIH